MCVFLSRVKHEVIPVSSVHVSICERDLTSTFKEYQLARAKISDEQTILSVCVVAAETEKNIRANKEKSLLKSSSNM